MKNSEFETEYQAWLRRGPDPRPSGWFNQPARAAADGELCVLGRDTSVAEAVDSMQGMGASAALVVDASGKVCGIFTEHDLLTRVVAVCRDPLTTRLSQVMTAQVETLPEGATLAQVLGAWAREGFRHLPLVNAERKPVAMLCAERIIAHVGELFPQEVMNAAPASNGPFLTAEGP